MTAKLAPERLFAVQKQGRGLIPLGTTIRAILRIVVPWRRRRQRATERNPTWFKTEKSIDKWLTLQLFPGLARSKKEQTLCSTCSSSALCFSHASLPKGEKRNLVEPRGTWRKGNNKLCSHACWRESPIRWLSRLHEWGRFATNFGPHISQFSISFRVHISSPRLFSEQLPE